MKRFFTYLILLIVVTGCGDEEYSEKEKEAFEALFYEQEMPSPYLDSENFVYNEDLDNKWYEDSLISLNSNLIDFKISVANKKEYEELGEILLRPNEKSNDRILHTDIEIVEKGDSLIVSFWQQHIFNCRTKGNIEIKGETINLLFAEVCSPYSQVIGEIAVINLQFILKKNEETENKKFEIMDSKYSYKKLLKN